MKQIKLIFATLVSFAPMFVAVPAVFVVSAKVAEAAYTRLESFETGTITSAEHSVVASNNRNFIRLESKVTLMSRIASIFTNIFSPRSNASNISRTASIADTISLTAPATSTQALLVETAAQVTEPALEIESDGSIELTTGGLIALTTGGSFESAEDNGASEQTASLSEAIQTNSNQGNISDSNTPAASASAGASVDFSISNFSWGVIDGPEDYNIAFEYNSLSSSAAGYNMAIFYFNQMPPADFIFNAKDAVKQSNKTPYAVVGVDYANCYSNDAETHKAILFSADSSCAVEPTEMDSSVIALDGVSSITLPVQVIYNSNLNRDMNEADYITIGLYSVDSDGNVIAVKNDNNRYHFIP